MDKSSSSWKRYNYNEERVNVEWMIFNSRDRRYIDIKNNKFLTVRVDPDNLTDTTGKSSDVSVEDSTLLAKKKQSDLKNIHLFLVSEVNFRCYFALPEGWKGYY